METEKKILRKRMQGIRDSLSSEIIKDFSREIFEKLRGMDIYKNTSVVYSYMSFRSEVFTWDFNERIIKDGKTLLLPKVISAKDMKFFKITRLDMLKKSFMGIMEPDETFEKIFDGPFIDGLMILPGLAFDRNFNRLGYGGGYYDRYLKEHSAEGKCLGVCFGCQLINEVPVNFSDYLLDGLVTESGILERMGGK